MTESVLLEPWNLVERFQTLISGVLVIIAALTTAVVIYRSAHAPLKAERKKQADEAAARANAHALALLVEVQHVSDRAGYIHHAMMDDEVTVPDDKWREWFRVETPSSLHDWRLATAHPHPIPERLKDLAFALRRYQWYVDTVQEWKEPAIYSHTEMVAKHARELIKAIEDKYGLNAQS